MEAANDISTSFPLLKDPSLSDDLKKFLIEKSLERERHEYERERAQTSSQLEFRKSRWSTPLAIALTGLITIGANFAADYWKTRQKHDLDESTASADARRKADAEIAGAKLKIETELMEAKRKAEAVERDFAYKIVERELSKEQAEADRAKVLLFLVRAGVLNGLNATALREMAEATLRKENVADAPGIPSLGGFNQPCDATKQVKVDTANFGDTRLLITSCALQSGGQYRYVYQFNNQGTNALHNLVLKDAAFKIGEISPGRSWYWRYSSSPPREKLTEVVSDEGASHPIGAVVPAEVPGLLTLTK